jgi:hypothetical protein
MGKMGTGLSSKRRKAIFRLSGDHQKAAYCERRPRISSK